MKPERRCEVQSRENEKSFKRETGHRERMGEKEREHREIV